MQPPLSAIVTCVFIVCGLVATLIMMKRLGGKEAVPTDRQIFWHRIFGWTFALLFLLMMGTMFSRFYEYWEEDPPRVVVHYTGAFALLILLLLKVSIPRFFPGFRKHLFPLGTMLLLFAFVSTSAALTHYLVRITQRVPYISHGSISSTPDVDLGKLLFIERCRTCHALDVILKPRTAESWQVTVEKMAKLAFPRIRPDEAKQILYYLIQTRTPHQPATSSGYKLLDTHCTLCHEPGEIFATVRTRKEWQEITKRMSDNAPTLIPAEGQAAIVDVLMEAQETLAKNGGSASQVKKTH